METRVYDLKTQYEEGLEQAAAAIREGELVIFPTETVYGIGADAENIEAVRKIYEVKGRPQNNPLIAHICSMEMVERLAVDISADAYRLMDAFWPGPMTIIFKKKDIVPKETTGGLETVAIRMPSHPDAARLISESGLYIAAPSANSSGRPSPSTAAHVIEDLSGKIDMILDGGPVDIGIESSIIDMSGDTPVILRPGFITKSKFEEIIGTVAIDKAIISPDSGIKPKAPGMKYTHYAPKGTLTIVESENDPSSINTNVINEINRLTKDAETANENVVVLTTEENKDKYICKNIILLGKTSSSSEVAKNLYSALRKCDDLGAKIIYSESFYHDELGGAVMNRLLKAAGQRVIKV